MTRRWSPLPHRTDDANKHPLKLTDSACKEGRKTRSNLLNYALLNDICPNNLVITDYFQERAHLEVALKALDKHYESLLALFNTLRSESTECYPFVSSKYFITFLTRSNLLPLDMLQFNEEEELTEIEKIAARRGKLDRTLGDDNIRQFQNVNRAQFFKALMWICQ